MLSEVLLMQKELIDLLKYLEDDVVKNLIRFVNSTTDLAIYVMDGH